MSLRRAQISFGSDQGAPEINGVCDYYLSPTLGIPSGSRSLPARPTRERELISTMNKELYQ